MMRRLDAADEKLRSLMQLNNPLLCALVNAVAFAAFALLMMTRSLPLLAGATVLQRALCVLLIALPLGAMLRFARGVSASRGEGLLGHTLLALVCAAAMLARVSFLDHVSSDYEIYLADWLNKFAAVSFRDGMRQNIGEYNVLYQYILFFITRLGVPRLYAVKAVSMLGDAFLAARNRRYPKQALAPTMRSAPA